MTDPRKRPRGARPPGRYTVFALALPALLVPLLASCNYQSSPPRPEAVARPPAADPLGPFDERLLARLAPGEPVLDLMALAPLRPVEPPATVGTKETLRMRLPLGRRPEWRLAPTPGPGSPWLRARAQGRWFLVEQDARDRIEGGIGVLHRRGDGTAVAFPLEERGAWHLAVADRRDDCYEVTGIAAERYAWMDWPAWSPDGLRVACWAVDHAPCLVIAERRGPTLTEVARMRPGCEKLWPVWAPDSRRLAARAIAAGGGREFVLVDALPRRDYEQVGWPVFSPDSAHVAYTARRGGKWFLVLDAREFGPYDDVLPPVFAPDGRRVAWGEQEGEEVWWRVWTLR